MLPLPILVWQLLGDDEHLLAVTQDLEVHKSAQCVNDDLRLVDQFPAFLPLLLFYERVVPLELFLEF